jgi:hypothetical protein
LNKKAEAGFSGIAAVEEDAEWSPGAYIQSALPSEKELKINIDELLRRYVSFYIRYAAEINSQRKKIKAGEIKTLPYRKMSGKSRIKNALMLSKKPGTIGELFDIFYGQKELHSRENLSEGDSLIISPTEKYNGCFGWLSYEPLTEPPFLTVAQTGTIGEAFVQNECCGVNDDCLILLPSESSPIKISQLFISAAIIRLERWRFSYGRKLTPARICDFPMPIMPELEKWVDEKLDAWNAVINVSLSAYD